MAWHGMGWDEMRRQRKVRKREGIRESGGRGE